MTGLARKNRSTHLPTVRGEIVGQSTLYSERRRTNRREQGASTLEYVLLVALVAMVSFGALVYLGRGSASPGRVAGHVATRVMVGDHGITGAEGSLIQGAASGTPVKAWCTSSDSACSDPMSVNGQTEVIHFWATGGIRPYSYILQGGPQFMSLDPIAREITITPTCGDLGTYSPSLIVHDSAQPTPATGELHFSLTVEKGTLC